MPIKPDVIHLMALDARSFIMLIKYFFPVDKFELIVYLFFICAIVKFSSGICYLALFPCVNFLLCTATDALVAVDRVSLICLRLYHHKLLLLRKSISLVNHWCLCYLCDQFLLHVVVVSGRWFWMQNDSVILSYFRRLFLHMWCCGRRLRAHSS